MFDLLAAIAFALIWAMHAFIMWQRYGFGPAIKVAGASIVFAAAVGLLLALHV